MFGSVRLYALAPAPWTEPLNALVLEIVRQDAGLAGDLRMERTLMLSGEFSNRKHLRKALGLKLRP
jgi:hypothetical protein